MNESHETEEMILSMDTVVRPTWLDRKTALELFTRAYFTLNITSMYPEDLSIPIYTYLAPFVVVPATILDAVIIYILLKNHLRTPTNIVLIGMAVNDMLTGLVSSIWTTYYYGFDGYKTDKERGLILFWCYGHYWLFMWLPNIFHTSSVLLTLYLAIQRYFYICRPTSVDRLCTNKRSITMIIILNSFATFTILPNFFYFQIVNFQHYSDTTRSYCVVFQREWYEELNQYIKYGLQYFQVFMLFVPCCLLLLFTYKLSSAMKESEIRKKACSTAGSRVVQKKVDNRSPGFSKSVTATNRILFSICGWVIMVEMFGCVGYIVLFLVELGVIGESVPLLRYMSIIRVLLILLAAPFQFCVYVSMSEQFRLTARQVFSGKKIYTTQVQKTLNGNTKYSLIIMNPIPDVYYEPLISVILRRIFERKPPDNWNGSTFVNQQGTSIELGTVVSTNLNTFETTPHDISRASAFEREKENIQNDKEKLTRLVEHVVDEVMSSAINEPGPSKNHSDRISVRYSKSSNSIQMRNYVKNSNSSLNVPENSFQIRLLLKAKSKSCDNDTITGNFDMEKLNNITEKRTDQSEEEETAF